MNLSPLPIQKFFGNNGRPLSGGLLFTYAAGTDNKIATATNSGGTPNTNPIVLDFRGECRVWIDPQQSYKFVLSPPGDTDPPTNPIWTVDNITAGPAQQDNSAVDTGSVNNIALSIPQISSPIAFTRIVFEAANTNTGAVTISINGGPANNLLSQALASLVAGDIKANGIYQAIFDGGQWQLQALSQAILPIWTTTHTYTASGLAQLLDSANPRIDLNQSTGAANNRRWYFSVSGESMAFGAINDALSSANDWVTINRTGVLIDSVAFPTATSGAFLVATSASLLTAHTAQFLGSGTSIALLAKAVTAGGQAITAWNNATAGNNVFVEFGTEATYTSRGSISYNRAGGLVAYNTTSDARFKKDIRDSAPAGSLIDAIKVRSFVWKDSGIQVDHWLVAQELDEVCPIAVTRNDEGGWSIDPSKIVPLLIKELQDLRRRVAALEGQGEGHKLNHETRDRS